MHETIGKMSSRIAQLVVAIEQLQAQVSTEPHPLLQGQDVHTMHPVVNTQPKKPVTTPEEDIIKAFGAFSIGDKGETTFHEAYATSEYLLNGPGLRSPSLPTFQRNSITPSSLPLNLELLSSLFPFPPENTNAVLEHFLPHIPSFSRAQFLVQSYFDNGAWSVDPVHKEDFINSVLGRCYPNQQPSITNLAADRLSAMFMVFSVGAFFDFDQPLVPREAEDFYTLARACLCLQPIYDHPTVYSIQSMTLMMWFQTLAGHPTYAYRPLLWGVLQTACELMHLNRDPQKLGIVGMEAEVRRVAFWELKSIEQWQAFASGRPAITSVIDDCARPYEDSYLNPNAPEADGTVWLGWKQHFTDLVNTVADQAFRGKDVTYSRILALDKQLRNHHTPTALRWPATKGAMYQKLGRTRLTGMQCLARIVLQESGLLHLHRWFFIQAIREKPYDPLEHPYAFSVRTVAYQILMALNTSYGHHPVLVSRCKTAWATAFSAALTMGTLVVSAPTIPLAHPAMIEFERACILFQNTSRSSVQPDNAADILMNLLQIAKQARDQGLPLTTSPESVTATDDTYTQRSSQSPVSVTSNQSWPTANGSTSNTPIATSSRVCHPPPPNYHHPKREYEPAELRENLNQWWDASTKEF
ncbi:hypothetical protein BU17DRAFT_91655 [Hysterangium stoloniferum]|nr:hypothetical protein BU17DRAFT_91655 [Hysterangium stoloniferum]